MIVNMANTTPLVHDNISGFGMSLVAVFLLMVSSISKLLNFGVDSINAKKYT